MPEVKNRALLFVALLFPAALIVAVGSWIPLPGLSSDFLARQPSGHGIGDRLSILALGLTPLLNGLAIGEMARLLFQWSPKSYKKRSQTAPWTSILNRMIVLGIAWLQAYGVATALEAAGAFNSRGSAAVHVAVATLVASTAVLLWLNDRLKIKGVRHGLWVLWIASFLLSLPENFADAIERTGSGAVGGNAWLINITYLVLGAILVVIAIRLWARLMERAIHPPEARITDQFSIFLWPVFLATYAGGYLMMLVLILLQDSWSPSQTQLRFFASAMITLLIPVFVYAYARLSFRDSAEDTYNRIGSYYVAAVIAAVEGGLFLSGYYLPSLVDMPLSVNGILIIVIVTVYLAAIAGHRTPRTSDNGPHTDS